MAGSDYRSKSDRPALLAHLQPYAPSYAVCRDELRRSLSMNAGTHSRVPSSRAGPPLYVGNPTSAAALLNNMQIERAGWARAAGMHQELPARHDPFAQARYAPVTANPSGPFLPTYTMSEFANIHDATFGNASSVLELSTLGVSSWMTPMADRQQQLRAWKADLDQSVQDAMDIIQDEESSQVDKQVPSVRKSSGPSPDTASTSGDTSHASQQSYSNFQTLQQMTHDQLLAEHQKLQSRVQQLEGLLARAGGVSDQHIPSSKHHTASLDPSLNARSGTLIETIRACIGSLTCLFCLCSSRLNVPSSNDHTHFHPTGCAN